MTLYRTADPQGRVHFGTLNPYAAQAQALRALGEAVSALEAQLGFALSVTAQPCQDGTLLAHVLLPDQHFKFETAMAVATALQEAVRPFGIDLDVVPDSDVPYAE